MTARAELRPEPAAPPRAGLLIAVLVGSAFVMILNETILSVALRDLTVDLGVPATTVQWLTSGFLLTMAVVIPITGYLLERFTPRAVFLTSLSLFSAGTLLAALAPGFAVLLAGRVVQAAGTAVMIPLLMTTIMRLVPAERRGATMGTITIVIAVAPALGPTIGGAVLAGLVWRWMFGLVLPLALVALVVGARYLRLSSTTRRVPFDVGRSSTAVRCRPAADEPERIGRSRRRCDVAVGRRRVGRHRCVSPAHRTGRGAARRRADRTRRRQADSRCGPRTAVAER